ncbi:hypothetical protein G7Y89_g12152 [Cudoniella acicularis]|uniref:G domain-containing protein n=1 Tax=Cudoniella acicularis TaxID=354080 RepID=A0A8H4VX77_9HELO|nr:hypothetical protein G7Y89_g12152 [Cudoniella acicularis]
MKCSSSRTATSSSYCVKAKFTRPALAMILFGKIGAGKSSLVESITGATGLAGDTEDHVTAKCEIASTTIEGREYFFIDTPGFDDENGAWNIFLKIIDTIDSIRQHAVFAGIWMMVSRAYQDRPKVKPQIILELDSGVAHESTSAAKIFRPARPPPSEVGQGSEDGSADQANDSNHKGPIPQDSAEEPSQTEESSEDHESSGTPQPSRDDTPGDSESPAGDNFITKLISDVAKNLHIRINSIGLSIEFASGGGPTFAFDTYNSTSSGVGHQVSGQPVQGINSRLDPVRSLDDFLVMHGQDSGPEARVRLGDDLNIRAGPDGSYEQNRALHTALEAHVRANGSRWQRM